jgi:rod shape-determining protein MreD
MPAPLLAFWGSLGVALVLTALALPAALPAELGWFRPQWAVLVLLFWVMMAPEAVGMVSAWLAGLFVDSVTGSLLGQHALTYVFIAWAGLSLYQRLRMYSLLQQALIVLLTVLAAELAAALMLRLARGQALSLALLWAPLVTALCWPLVYGALAPLRRWLGPSL